jgi:hypothetical protein
VEEDGEAEERIWAPLGKQNAAQQSSVTAEKFLLLISCRRHPVDAY